MLMFWRYGICFVLHFPGSGHRGTCVWSSLLGMRGMAVTLWDAHCIYLKAQDQFLVRDVRYI